MFLHFGNPPMMAHWKMHFPFFLSLSSFSFSFSLHPRCWFLFFVEFLLEKESVSSSGIHYGERNPTNSLCAYFCNLCGSHHWWSVYASPFLLTLWLHPSAESNRWVMACAPVEPLVFGFVCAQCFLQLCSVIDHSVFEICISAFLKDLFSRCMQYSELRDMRMVPPLSSSHRLNVSCHFLFEAAYSSWLQLLNASPHN